MAHRYMCIPFVQSFIDHDKRVLVINCLLRLELSLHVKRRFLRSNFGIWFVMVGLKLILRALKGLHLLMLIIITQESGMRCGSIQLYRRSRLPSSEFVTHIAFRLRTTITLHNSSSWLELLLIVCLYNKHIRLRPLRLMSLFEGIILRCDLVCSTYWFMIWVKRKYPLSTMSKIFQRSHCLELSVGLRGDHMTLSTLAL